MLSHLVCNFRKSAFMSPTSQSVSSTRDGLITLRMFSLCSVYFTKFSTSSLRSTLISSPTFVRFNYVSIRNCFPHNTKSLPNIIPIKGASYINLLTCFASGLKPFRFRLTEANIYRDF